MTPERHQAGTAPGRAFAPGGAAPGPVARSSFHLALRLLPESRRAAMFEVYAFCRAVDDVADGAEPAPARRALLERWREDVGAMCAGAAPPWLAALGRHAAAFGLARADFEAVIDGMLMDAQDQPLCAPEAATLDLYCDRVASAVGRLSVRVFGLPYDDGVLLAHYLGRALQLTNILRDVDEDAAIGRCYLPRELLLEVGVRPEALAAGARAIAADPAMPLACARIAGQALAYFNESTRIMRRQPPACVRAPRLMGAVYRALLARLLARGWRSPRAAVRVGRFARIGILLRHAVA